MTNRELSCLCDLPYFKREKMAKWLINCHVKSFNIAMQMLLQQQLLVPESKFPQLALVKVNGCLCSDSWNDARNVSIR